MSGSPSEPAMDELQTDWLANGVTGEGMKLEGYNLPDLIKASWCLTETSSTINTT